MKNTWPNLTRNKGGKCSKIKCLSLQAFFLQMWRQWNLWCHICGDSCYYVGPDTAAIEYMAKVWNIIIWIKYPSFMCGFCELGYFSYTDSHCVITNLLFASTLFTRTDVSQPFWFKATFAGYRTVWPRRTKAEQEVLSLIAPLGKLCRFEEAADFFQVNE